VVHFYYPPRDVAHKFSAAHSRSDPPVGPPKPQDLFVARGRPNSGTDVHQHTYFDLNGAETPVVEHTLSMPSADTYVVVDGHLIPTGEVDPVTPCLDFTRAKPIGRDIASGTVTPTGGHDNAWVFSNWVPGQVEQVVAVSPLQDPNDDVALHRRACGQDNVGRPEAGEVRRSRGRTRLAERAPEGVAVSRDATRMTERTMEKGRAASRPAATARAMEREPAS
jgi:hypothetical protein